MGNCRQASFSGSSIASLLFNPYSFSNQPVRFFPPPAYPWGIIGTAVAHFLIQVMLWVVMYYNPVVFRLYTGKRYFFLLWLFVLMAIELLFFLAYVLSERNTTYVAAGGGAFILIVATLVFPLKIPYREASIVGGEPLIKSEGGGGNEDDNDE
jgi:hypothetical protein